MATFERYWMAPISAAWNADNSSWLSLEHLRGGSYESSEGCSMVLREDGEIWESCRDAARSLDGKVPFLISKYQPLRRR